MTEERKQELRQLLIEARQGLQIRFEYGSLPIPIDIYRRYVEQRWASYGVDFLSFVYSTRFTIFIVGENGELKPFYKMDRNSKILKFIKEELDPFIRKGDIPAISTGNYIVESGCTDGSRLFCLRRGIKQQHHILERLLHIAIVRGVEDAVSAFERSCCPEGVHGFFQYVALVDGIRIETEIRIFEGIKLIPLPSLQTTKIEEEVLRYLPGFPFNAFVDQADSFFEKTLLIIDQPGFSIFHKPPEQLFKREIQVSDLPFQVEENDVKCRNRKEINAFVKSFFQALSLVCNSTFKIYHIGWFWEEDKTIHAQSPMIGNFSLFQERDLFAGRIMAGQSEIEEAKCLYYSLNSFNIETSEKLQIPINRWIKSKTSESFVDKMIDLGIAFETLYVPAKVPGKRRKIVYNLKKNASRYLGKNKEDREKLKRKIKVIYACRCDAAHEGKLGDSVTIDGKSITMSKFIEKSQNLCRKSIIRILEDGKFPDWNNLVLGEESS